MRRGPPRPISFIFIPGRADGRSDARDARCPGLNAMPAAVRPDPNRDPIGPFLHYLMSECGVSPNTLAAYRADIMRFNRWRKAHAPGALGALDIAELVGYVDH